MNASIGNDREDSSEMFEISDINDFEDESSWLRRQILKKLCLFLRLSKKSLRSSKNNCDMRWNSR